MKWGARLTVDMSPEEHMYLKVASALVKMSMREFVLMALLEKIQKIEDQNLSKQASVVIDKMKKEHRL